jgi:hypothetical protein
MKCIHNEIVFDVPLIRTKTCFVKIYTCIANYLMSISTCYHSVGNEFDMPAALRTLIRIDIQLDERLHCTSSSNRNQFFKVYDD